MIHARHFRTLMVHIQENVKPLCEFSAIQTLAIETNHEDLKDLKEIFAGCRGGKSACPFEVFEIFVVHFFFSAPSRLGTPTV